MRYKNSGTPESNSIFKIVSNTYKDFAENTSIHGLKFTVDPEIGIYERFFWIVVIISGLCGAVYMTVLFCERYNNDPTMTSLSTSYAPTTAIPFPAVSICNLNFILESKVETFMKKLKYNNTEESVIKNALPQLMFLLDSATNNLSDLEILQNVLEQNGYFNLTLVLDEISQDCNDMLLHCMWNRRKISCSENFHKIFISTGTCCTFNLLSEHRNVQLYSQYNGMGTGLKVLLNSQMQEVYYQHRRGFGFKVGIHRPTETVLTNVRLMAVGKIAYLQVLGRKVIFSEEVKSLSIKQRRCRYPDEYILTYLGDEYSDTKCLLECEAYWYFHLCGCVPFHLSFSDKPLCSISNIPCLQHLKTNQVLTNKIQKCDCTSLCEYVYYEMVSTSTRIKNNSDFSMMKIGNFSIHDKYNLVHVFFVNNRQIMYRRATVKSPIYLLSSFGGVYGLFLGCSLITIAEIIYYGFFRFLVNFKLFGKIHTDVKDKSKRKTHMKRVKFEEEFKKDRIQSIYGSNTFMY